MASIGEIVSLPNGAQFYRADLHIHSFGGSHDVKDAGMTSTGIVKAAIDVGLDIIAITDHNEIQNVRTAIKAAQGSRLLVIPGVELSTPNGHLLCYLPTCDLLETFFRRVDVVDCGNPNGRCQNSILECLKLLEKLSGVAVLAHVDAPSGFEIETPGNSPHKVDVLCHRALLGIELRTPTSNIYYSDVDPDSNRAYIGRERIARLGLGSKQFLARLLGSDAHSLNALGRNAQGKRKVTRIKMDAPCFDGFRIALEDSDARVRIEDQIPSAVPYIIGMGISGGFLDGQKLHFSPNLNCIIGGRGTGKSTMFEAVRCLTGELVRSPIVDSEIWPAQLNLFWQDQAGQAHTLIRPFEGEMSNSDDPVNGPVTFDIESYGQGDTAQMSKEAHENPIALSGYLDRLIHVGELHAEEDAARDEILKLHAEIEKAVKNVDAIPLHERALATTQQQLAALEQAKAKEVIALQRKLAEEREIRLQISTKLAEIEEGLDSLSPKDAIDEVENLADAESLAVGTSEFRKILDSLRAFEKQATRAQKDAKDQFRKLQTETENQLSSWKAKEAEALNVIETKKKALEAKNIRLDMVYIQKLAKDEAKLKTDLANLRRWKPYLDDLKRKRIGASKKRWAVRDRIGTVREAYARTASETLKSVLSDFSVSLKFSRSAYSPDAERQIIQAMGWRTIQVSRAGLLIERLTVPGLLQAIDKRDTTAIMSVLTSEGARIFDKGEADRIIEQLSVPAIRFALERCEVHDLPRLSVTKAIAGPGRTKRYFTREFSKLSLGQQQSVMLALMLSSKSNAPLIIDQPEDNLDGEFIYHSLVPVLRLAKERRQIIIVTHNANIAVLGDAEQIITWQPESTNPPTSQT